MALTTAQQVRLRIQDQPRIADVQRYGDGSGSAFQLDHLNITSATGYIMVSAGGTPPTGWSATAATFNSSGYVTFSAVPSANSALRFRYVHSVFSEDEIDHFTAVGGNVNGAALEAVQTLMFDGLRRSKWAAPDGSEHDDTHAMKLLNDIYDKLKNEQQQEAIAGGGLHSWALTQGEV
jgi:hypothetical protein